MSYSKTIYKQDSSGKTRMLHIYTEGADVIQKSGVVGGAMVLHRSTSVGKNIGKTNETSPEEQAVLEATSKIEAKMTTGYFNSIEEIKQEEVILPMLAKSYGPESHKIDWKYPVFIQPKLDGMRCLAILKDGEVTLLSRQGKIIDTCQHIIDLLIPLAQRTSLVLDGEIYAHGKNFQENMRLVKKVRPGETEQLAFTIYDEASPVTSDYMQRYQIITSVIQELNSDKIQRIRNVRLTTPDEIKKYHSEFIGEGYEGSIIRHGMEGYAMNKRSSSLLKYKDFIDVACKVINILPSDKRPEQGMCECVMPDDDTKIFRTGMKFSHAEREEILTNKENYIGRTAEVRFFEYSEDGIPRFPVTVGFREDK